MVSKEATKHQEKGLAVGELLTDDQLKVFGYIPLSFAVMQTAGGAAQTLGAIRSHWGKETFADPRTIAVAACLDESTIRRRHLPKLHSLKLKYLGKRMIRSRLGQRAEWYLTTDAAAAGLFSKKFATLPRWAALSLPEWSYRAVYATVLQRSLATSRGSIRGPVKLEVEDIASGNYGRHNFSISHLCDLTGLTRHSVIAAKEYLLESNWLTWDEGFGHGKELYLNMDRLIPMSVLQDAHRTTRAMMFKKDKLNTKLNNDCRHGLKKLGKTA